MIHESPEHEFEAVPGLPEPLPAGERVLWQGAPDWRALARTAFHTRKLVIYFALILAAHAAARVADGAGVPEVLRSSAALALLATLAVSMAALLAWLAARTALYTITDKRVVMRIGIVLCVTFNLPFRCIESAALRATGGDTGDIALELGGRDRIAYLQLWPHARPWQFKRPQPMLRALPQVERVGALLARAIANASGGNAQLVQPAGQARPQAAGSLAPSLGA